jgi:hypothetical protein
MILLNPFNIGLTTSSGFDMSSAWKIFFDASINNFTTSAGNDGNSYFLKGTDSIMKVTDNIVANNVLPGFNTGFYVVSNGLLLNTDEKASLQIKMTDGVTANELSHKDQSFTMFVVYTWDGNTNDINYKHWSGGKRGFKIEGPSAGINITDGFNSLFNGTGTASNGQVFSFDPSGSYSINTGNPFFICVQRDVSNKKYIINTGEILSGNTIGNLKTHDTAINSSLYVTNPFNNSNDNIEFLVDENSILHAFGYVDDVVTKTDIEGTYLNMINIFG